MVVVVDEDVVVVEDDVVVVGEVVVVGGAVVVVGAVSVVGVTTVVVTATSRAGVPREAAPAGTTPDHVAPPASRRTTPTVATRRRHATPGRPGPGIRRRSVRSRPRA